MRQRNNLLFQNFGDISKCLRQIFSQLYFENFWLYLLGEVAMTQSPWIKKSRDIFQNVKTVQQQGSPISILSESSKTNLLIKVLYIWFDLCRRFPVPSCSECILCISQGWELFRFKSDFRFFFLSGKIKISFFALQVKNAVSE